MKLYELENGKQLIIREATKEDAVDVIDYINKISSESDFLTFGKGEFNISLEAEEEIIESSQKSDNSIFITAEIDGEIVGQLIFRGGHRTRIRHIGEFGISTLKKYWGIGIGRKILDNLIDWAQSSNVIRKINLKVRTDNDRAITLYENLGFKKEGLITRQFYLNNTFYDVYEMGLEID